MFAVRRIARRRFKLFDLGLALIVGSAGALSQMPSAAAAVAVAGLVMVALAPRS